ncbi:MAG: hypothetical protein ACLPUO_14020 [Streptosporangiaceae bacterium]
MPLIVPQVHGYLADPTALAASANGKVDSYAMLPTGTRKPDSLA